ncbi:MAG: precorrin-6A reductase [Crocinitomicaceae bacterium]|nr:precorrin-6A reductase [Crocinitomicaceae bacterium]
MILVFGGTTEGNQVISTLEELGLDFVYSTKSKLELTLPPNGVYRSGAMTPEGLTDFIEEHEIEVIINAAHPFASELHHTIDQAREKKRTEVIRLERTYPEHVRHDSIHYVETYVEAQQLLMDRFYGKRGLMLTGVQSIPVFKAFWSENECYFRIINRRTSLEIAEDAGFPAKQLVLEDAKALIGGEEELIDRLGIDFMVTKESGKSGALDHKMEIAVNTDIPLVIIKRPQLPSTFKIVENITALRSILNLLNGVKQ